MTYRAIVKNGVVAIPDDAEISDGTEVEVRVCANGTRLGDLLDHAGRWQGDDADAAIETIYRSRSSRRTAAPE